MKYWGKCTSNKLYKNFRSRYKSRNLPKAGEMRIFIHIGFAQDLPKSLKTIVGHYEGLMDTIEMWTDYLAAIYGLGYKAMVFRFTRTKFF